VGTGAMPSTGLPWVDAVPTHDHSIMERDGRPTQMHLHKSNMWERHRLLARGEGQDAATHTEAGRQAGREGLVEKSEAPTPNVCGQSSGSRSIAAHVQPNCQPSQWLGGLLVAQADKREGGLDLAHNHRPAHAHMQSVCGQAKAKDRKQEKVANKSIQQRHKRTTTEVNWRRQYWEESPAPSGGEPQGTKNTRTCGNREPTYLPSSLCGFTARSDRLDLWERRS